MEHFQLKEDEEIISKSESLGQKIEFIIQKLPPKEVTLIEIIDIVGTDSMLLLTIFLSLIFLVPVSIPGVSTVFGTGILLIGITRLFNGKLWLPKKIANRKLSSEQLRDWFKRALLWFRRLERISRSQRMPKLTSDGWIRLVNNLSFILAAMFLMAPFGGIPFSNTLPALALIFLSIGMLQRDGASILLGYLTNIMTIIYFTILFLAGGLLICMLFQFLN